MAKKQVDIVWRWGLVIMFAVAMVFNGLAGSTNILGGLNTAQVSDSFPNLFAPAGVTFAIWGVIYALLVGFILYVLGVGRPKNARLSDTARLTVTKLLTVNLALNSLWILAWQYKVLWLSVILMLGILWTLGQIVNTVRVYKLRGKEYVQARLPFSVYFGWITVATVANITTLLVSIKWDGWGLSKGTWMVAILLVAAAIGLFAALRNNDAAYLAVFVWAYAGILLKHLSPEGFNGAYPTTIVCLTVLLAVLSTMTLLLVRERIQERT